MKKSLKLSFFVAAACGIASVVGHAWEIGSIWSVSTNTSMQSTCSFRYEEGWGGICTGDCIIYSNVSCIDDYSSSKYSCPIGDSYFAEVDRASCGPDGNHLCKCPDGFNSGF